MDIDVKCSYCGKEYILSRGLYNKRIKRNKNKEIYCSKECSQKARITRIKKTCANCGKLVERPPFKLKQSISGNVFCSHSCSSIYNNSLREKNSINTYRRVAFENYKHECAICGWNKDERILEVHHIDENRKNNKLDNLIILCPICHRYLTLHLKSLDELQLLVRV